MASEYSASQGPQAESETARRMLVLGATGLVGRAVCGAAVADGYQVHGVGRSRTGPVATGLSYTSLDVVREPEALRSLLEALRPQVVVNAAGALWTADLDLLERANITMVEAVVDEVRRSRSRPRLLQLGSMYEYGRDGSTDDPAGLPAYGRTKLIGSSRVLAAADRGDLDGAVLRLSTVVGAGVAAASALGSVARRLLTARQLGRQRPVVVSAAASARDYLDVRDAAGAVLQASATPSCAGALPIGSGKLVQLRSAVALLADVAGVAVDLDPQPRTTDSGWAYPAADLTHTWPALGWRARHDLRCSLAMLWLDLVEPRAVLDRSFTASREACSNATLCPPALTGTPPAAHIAD